MGGRYYKFRYGDGTKYGTIPDTEPFPLWALQIAWDGSYSGISGTNNEAVRMTGMSSRRGRINYPEPTKDGYGGDGVAYVKLDNSDGRYDPWNEDSPLYPYVKPGKFCRLWFWEPYDDEPYYIMRGILSEITPIGKDYVTLKIVDGLTWLAEQVITIPLEDNQKYKDWVTSALLYADWPQAEWGILTAGTGQEAFTLWAWRENALKFIQKLTSAEFGLFWHASNGYAKFYTRDYEQSSVATITEADCLRDIGVWAYWDTVRNHVQVSSSWWDTFASTEIWKLDSVGIFIEDGESLDFLAEFKKDGQNVGGFNLSSNLEVNAESDGSGADLTAGCSLGYGDEGGGTTVTLTNNSGSDGYIIELSIEGQGYGTPNKSTWEETDADSISDYGRHSFTLDSPYQQDGGLYGMRGIALGLIEQFPSPSPLPVFQLRGQLQLQFLLDQFSKIKVEFPSKGIDDYFRVGLLEHELIVSPGGNGVTGFDFLTTVYCEPYFTISQGE